jgi:hypothetical protein
MLLGDGLFMGLGFRGNSRHHNLKRIASLREPELNVYGHHDEESLKLLKGELES